MQPDMFEAAAVPQAKVGEGNGKFLGHVANGMSRDELIRRWKAGEYPDLHEGLAKNAMRGRP